MASVTIRRCVYLHGFKDHSDFFVNFDVYLHDDMVGNDYFIFGDFNCVNDGQEKIE